MVDLFDYKVVITVEADNKTIEEFDAFLAAIKDALSKQRSAGKITGSKLTVDKKFASQDWHDGL